jgi:hypothetical protein
MKPNSPLEWALKYLRDGFSAIPLVPKTKKPIIPSWEPYMKRLPTEDEVRDWWAQHPDANIGIVTGAVSDLVIVDVDPRNGGEESVKQLHLPPTYCVKTGGGGWHYYYRPNGKNIAKAKGYLPGIDILAEKAYAVAPPSIHDKTGLAYEPVGETVDIVEAPAWLYATKKEEKLWESGIDGAPEGKRNETAASLCGKLFSGLPRELWETAGWATLEDWNRRNDKPLEVKELRSVFESILKKAEESLREEEAKEEKGSSIAKQIIEMILEQEPELMHDDIGMTFMRIRIGDHFETHPTNSVHIKRWVAREFWNLAGKPAKPEYIKQALEVISSMAMFDGEKKAMANRIAESDSAFWYDLCDAKWNAVRIDGSGWKIVANPPPIFRHHKHQLPQVFPAGGDISRLLEFVNISDGPQRLLLQVYLVTCFIPNIPHPIPVLYGSQGSAKSTFMRVLRRIIDPSSVELLALPTQSEQLVQQLSHHCAPYYDNVTTLPEWLSDALCRAVTGEGYSKRELYSDDEDVIYTFRCCVGLNGINIAAQKPDLLDRSILFNLERIPPEKRQAERAFWERFEEARPAILGGVFDTLAKAITIRQNIKVDELPRMADFTLWGCAVAEALGYSQEEFLAAYRSNINRQNEEAINEHPVATTVCVFMEGRNSWQGTSTELLSALETIAESLKINIKHNLWPKGPQVLSRRLNEVKTNLDAVGISIGTGRGTARKISIVRTGNTDGTVKHDATDDTDGISETDKPVPVTLDRIRQFIDPKAEYADDGPTKSDANGGIPFK